MDQQAILTTALAQTERSERCLQAQYAVTRALAEFSTLAEAGQAILRAIGESMGWKLGIFWNVNEQTETLRFVNVWHAPRVVASEFVKDSQDRYLNQVVDSLGAFGPQGNRFGLPMSRRTLLFAGPKWR